MSGKGGGDDERAKSEKQFGKEAYKKKDFDRAISHFLEAARSNPRDVGYPYLIAKVKFHQKKYDECIEYCKNAVRVGKEYKGDVKIVAKAYVRQGRAKIAMGKLDEGKKDIEKAIDFLSRIAHVKFEKKHLDECLKFCERAIKIGKEHGVNFGTMEKVLKLELSVSILTDSEDTLQNTCDTPTGGQRAAPAPSTERRWGERPASQHHGVSTAPAPTR